MVGYHQREHAWLLVNTEDEFITTVESTNVRVIRRNDTHYEDYRKFYKFFPTLQDALKRRYDEFDWWNTHTPP